MSSSPILQAAISACVLTAASNIAAQYISAYRSQTPFAINWIPVLQFVIYTAINSPPNFLWQQFLESAFPSYTLPPPPPTSDGNKASGKSHPSATTTTTTGTTKPRLSAPNTLIKFLLDQSVGAVVNTLLFSLCIASLRGASWEQAVGIARRDFWPLMTAGWKLWPLVSALNFSVVRSVQTRSLVLSLAGVGWSVYLSLVAGGK